MPWKPMVIPLYIAAAARSVSRFKNGRLQKTLATDATVNISELLPAESSIAFAHSFKVLD